MSTQEENRPLSPATLSENCPLSPATLSENRPLSAATRVLCTHSPSPPSSPAPPPPVSPKPARHPPRPPTAPKPQTPAPSSEARSRSVMVMTSKDLSDKPDVPERSASCACSSLENSILELVGTLKTQAATQTEFFNDRIRKMEDSLSSLIGANNTAMTELALLGRNVRGQRDNVDKLETRVMEAEMMRDSSDEESKIKSAFEKLEGRISEIETARQNPTKNPKIKEALRVIDKIDHRVVDLEMSGRKQAEAVNRKLEKTIQSQNDIIEKIEGRISELELSTPTHSSPPSRLQEGHCVPLRDFMDTFTVPPPRRDNGNDYATLNPLTLKYPKHERYDPRDAEVVRCPVHNVHVLSARRLQYPPSNFRYYRGNQDGGNTWVKNNRIPSGLNDPTETAGQRGDKGHASPDHEKKDAF